MGNKIPTFTDQQLDDYQVNRVIPVVYFFLINFLSDHLGLYVFYKERDTHVSDDF